MGGKVGREGEYLTFEGNYFRNGFMYKLFNSNAIVSECGASVTVIVSLHAIRYLMVLNQLLEN